MMNRAVYPRGGSAIKSGQPMRRRQALAQAAEGGSTALLRAVARNLLGESFTVADPQCVASILAWARPAQIDMSCRPQTRRMAQETAPPERPGGPRRPANAAGINGGRKMATKRLERGGKTLALRAQLSSPFYRRKGKGHGPTSTPDTVVYVSNAGQQGGPRFSR